MEHIIIDSSSNTGKIYIDENSDNCCFVENARVFPTKEEAEEYITNSGWNEWAFAVPLSNHI